MWYFIFDLLATVYFPKFMCWVSRVKAIIFGVFVTILMFSIFFGPIAKRIFFPPVKKDTTHAFVFPTFILSTIKGWQHIGCETQEALDTYRRHEMGYQVDRCEALIASGTCQRLEKNAGVFVLQNDFGVVKVEEVATKRIYWAMESAINGG